jgi:hypothetical protein
MQVDSMAVTRQAERVIMVTSNGISMDTIRVTVRRVIDL